jgi:hypothetical protein
MNAAALLRLLAGLLFVLLAAPAAGQTPERVDI